MVSHMKTTIDIDDRLFREARIRAINTDRSFRAVVEAALRAYLADTIEPADDRTARVAAILQEIDALPILDDRSADEVLGYDETGGFR